MIDVTLWLDKSGCLYGIDASGHSGSAAKGEDIICSAASILLRTVSRALKIEPTVKFIGKIEERGKLQFRISLLERSRKEWLMGISAFTVLGLKDLEAEYPSYCRIHLKKGNPVI